VRTQHTKRYFIVHDRRHYTYAGATAVRRPIISTAQRRVWHFNWARVHTLCAYLKCRTITAQKCHIAPETSNISSTSHWPAATARHSFNIQSRHDPVFAGSSLSLGTEVPHWAPAASAVTLPI